MLSRKVSLKVALVLGLVSGPMTASAQVLIPNPMTVKTYWDAFVDKLHEKNILDNPEQQIFNLLAFAAAEPEACVSFSMLQEGLRSIREDNPTRRRLMNHTTAGLIYEVARYNFPEQKARMARFLDELNQNGNGRDGFGSSKQALVNFAVRYAFKQFGGASNAYKQGESEKIAKLTSDVQAAQDGQAILAALARFDHSLRTRPRPPDRLPQPYNDDTLMSRMRCDATLKSLEGIIDPNLLGRAKDDFRRRLTPPDPLAPGMQGPPPGTPGLPPGFNKTIEMQPPGTVKKSQ